MGEPRWTKKSIVSALDEATALIQSALVLDPNNAWAWTRFGWVGIYSDQAENARARFERAMVLSPVDHSRLACEWAYAHRSRLQVDWKKPLRSPGMSFQGIPMSPGLYPNRAGWAAMNQDMPTARWAAQRLLAHQPDFTISNISPFR